MNSGHLHPNFTPNQEQPFLKEATITFPDFCVETIWIFYPLLSLIFSRFLFNTSSFVPLSCALDVANFFVINKFVIVTWMKLWALPSYLQRMSDKNGTTIRWCILSFYYSKKVTKEKILKYFGEHKIRRFVSKSETFRFAIGEGSVPITQVKVC